MMFGDDNNPPNSDGIFFDATVQAPAGGGGTIFFTQLIKADNSYVVPNLPGGDELKTAPGQWELDSSQMLNGVSTNIAAGAQGQLTVRDAPAVSPPQNRNGRGTVVADEKFETFLMYQDSAAGSIPVPVERIDWYWSGKTVAAALVSSDWSKQPVEQGPVGGASSFPQWSRNVRAEQWVPFGR